MSSGNAFNETQTHRGDQPIDMAEMRRYRQGNGAPAAELESAVGQTRRLTLSWSDGRSGQFPLMWLRDHCACDQCRHPMTRERLYKLLDDPLWERFEGDEALVVRVRCTLPDADLAGRPRIALRCRLALSALPRRGAGDAAAHPDAVA